MALKHCVLNYIVVNGTILLSLLTLMSAKHWSWGYFFTDGHFFRNNNSFKNAWCIACLNHHKELLRQSDILGMALTGISNDHTDAERETQGSH